MLNITLDTSPQYISSVQRSHGGDLQDISFGGNSIQSMDRSIDSSYHDLYDTHPTHEHDVETKTLFEGRRLDPAVPCVL
jgi:hypothetical protein